MREKLLQEENLSLAQLTRIVRSTESIKFQALTINEISGPNVFQVNSNVNRILDQRNILNNACYRCGDKNHFANDPLCPARGFKCPKCSKMGHYPQCCKSTGKQVTNKRQHSANFFQQQNKKFKSHNVRLIESTENNVNQEQQSFIYQIGDGDEMMWLKIGGVLIQMLVDSGSSKNIIDFTTWEYMKQQGVKVRQPERLPNTTLRGYGTLSKPLQISTVFEAVISVDGLPQSEQVATFFVVVDGAQPLLGKETAKLLGVLTIGLPQSVNSVVSFEKRPFPKMKNVLLRIPVNSNVNPVAQRVRRPPVALLSRIEEKIAQLLANDIIEPVEGGATWVSPLVTILKDNGDLRLCVDMRRANQAIIREHYMMPTFEDFLPRLKSANFFSRLDIKDAFHQIELEESSRYITTFISHKGLFRYKRLMFGISCAPEMFQKTLEQILIGCENVINYIDDIFVYGETQEEHDRSLSQILAVLKSRNILLNNQKCIFKVREIEFLGHKISAEGVRPMENKIGCLQKFRKPRTSEEVRSFLGLVTYIGKFIPNLATITAPLRELICKNIRFKWEAKHEESFQHLKQAISNVRTLSFFDNNLRTRVVADASPVALGAVLIQFIDHTDNEPRVIRYASKSLSKTESRYCQTEKEALALVWAVEKFSIYLIGREFELETDHKPLEIIFAPTSTPCARIERWVLRLQSFRFVVKYRKGSGNIADSLSRLVEQEPSGDFEQDNKFLVLAVKESVAIDIQELEEETLSDLELKTVKDCLRTGIWSSSLVKHYEPFANELGILSDMVVRCNKLVVPKILRHRMLELGHEGHPGESVMKKRLRERAWWPMMDKDIKKYVLDCEGCRLTGLPSKPIPMARRELPLKPWIDIAIDFMGPLPSGEYLLVVIDYFSRYKEVEIMNRITSRDTVDKLNQIFTRLGYPRTITLDNAKQFVGKEFEEFCKVHGITLNHTAPYWPQENGLVERQNRSLLKRLQISHAFGRDWKKDLKDYLMMYYTTPHSTTGKTPTELCYGRTIRSKLPTIEDLETTPTSTDYRDQDRMRKHKGKETEDIRRGAETSKIQQGDKVLMENLVPSNKLSTKFGKTQFTVTERVGPRAVVENDSGRSFERNVAHLKRIPLEQDSSSEIEDLDEATLINTPITIDDEVSANEQEPAINNTLISSNVAEVRGRLSANRERRKPSRFLDYVMKVQQTSNFA
ncbi:uncharacterized protein K02A2.6-like [Uranotaenia lowii]|uniref:uncharacterized protein K02A2.6-like n=1 Tax=Uranotaenia lowii TaxID=190385 RepID=UPI00247AF827|nr:uncharacterized protein K02A2.6-like [Uranotaenia lowii]